MEKLALFGNKKNLVSYLADLNGFKGFEKIKLVFPEDKNEEMDFLGGIIEYPHPNLEFIINSYSTIPLLIFFDSKTLTEKELEDLENLCRKGVDVKGILDLQVSLTFQLPILREAFLGIFPKKILGDILTNSLLQLERIKEVHKKLVPIRSGTRNGITYYSKFSSGESNGGEFFNFNNQNLGNFFFYSNTDSYGISNQVLSAYESFEFKNYSLEEFQNFIKAINSEKFDFKKNKLELLLASIDRKDLKIEGYNFSGCRFFQKEEIKLPSCSINEMPLENFNEGYFSFKIGRGDRLYIFSSGYLRNMEKYYPGFEIRDILTRADKLPAEEALNEFFFQLKRKVDGKFPFYDSSVIIIEVDKNVLIQV